MYFSRQHEDFPGGPKTKSNRHRKGCSSRVTCNPKDQSRTSLLTTVALQSWVSFSFVLRVCPWFATFSLPWHISRFLQRQAIEFSAILLSYCLPAYHALSSLSVSWQHSPQYSFSMPKPPQSVYFLFIKATSSSNSDSFSRFAIQLHHQWFVHKSKYLLKEHPSPYCLLLKSKSHLQSSQLAWLSFCNCLISLRFIVSVWNQRIF